MSYVNINKPLTRRERLERCYAYQEINRPAVYSRAGFPGNDPTYDKLKAYLHEHTELKAGWGGWRETSYPTDYRKEAWTEDFERHIAILHTPKGDLRSTTLASLKGQPGMAETYLLKDREDAEKYLSLPMPEISGDTSSFFTTRDKIADIGIVDVLLGFNPGGAVATLFGTDAFAITSKFDRDIIHELCQREMTIIINRLKFLLDNKVGPFSQWLEKNISFLRFMDLLIFTISIINTTNRSLILFTMLAGIYIFIAMLRLKRSFITLSIWE